MLESHKKKLHEAENLVTDASALAEGLTYYDADNDKAASTLRVAMQFIYQNLDKANGILENLEMKLFI